MTDQTTKDRRTDAPVRVPPWIQRMREGQLRTKDMTGSVAA